MTRSETDSTVKSICQVLEQNGLISAGCECQVTSLSGDGSGRRFLRLACAGSPSFFAVLPDPDAPKGMAEARASYLIGKHLGACNIPVPKIYAYDDHSGLIIFEDLGDLLLHQYLLDHHESSLSVQEYYKKAISALCRMQLNGKDDFDPAFCWDTPRYDRQLMLERESEYFMQAFCREYLGLHSFDQGLEREFAFLADRVALEPADYLLHRDFQSRNLMIVDEEVRIIDFQGARFGPLAYDLASLLRDPYAGLSERLQNKLFDYYLFKLSDKIPLDPDSFYEGYYCISIQRNLQVLGAYAFLSHQKKKKFFLKYIKPAVSSLYQHLSEPQGMAVYPCLRALLRKIVKMV